MQKVTWTGNGTLEYVEKAEPPDDHLKAEEVLIRVTAVGLCGTDVRRIGGKVWLTDPPLVLGHEIAGVIEKTGPGVTSVAPGDRITVDSVVGCGECEYCHRGSNQFCPNGYEIGQTVDGGMQEFLKLPERNVFKIPDQMSDEEAAILDVEVLGALKKAGVEKDSSVLVIGPGSGGLVAAQLAKILGAGKVLLLGTRSERLELGKRLGADITLEVSDKGLSEAVLEATGGSGPDMVVDMAGSASSLALTFELVTNQGKVVLYGIHGSPIEFVDMDRITLKDLTVYGTLSDRVGWQDMIRWVANGSLNLKEIITHRFPLREAQKAYEIIRDRSEGAIKAVLFP